MSDTVYRIDQDRLGHFSPAAQAQIEAKVNDLIEYRVLTEVEWFTCSDCGMQSTNRSAFVLMNVEPAHFGMDDPYPGYAGDLVCRRCALGDRIAAGPVVDVCTIDWGKAERRGFLSDLTVLRQFGGLIRLDADPDEKGDTP